MTDYNALGYNIPTTFPNGAVMPPYLGPMIPSPMHAQMLNNCHNPLMRTQMPLQHPLNYPPPHLQQPSPYPLRNPVRQLSPPTMTITSSNPQPITVQAPSRPPPDLSSKESGTSPEKTMPQPSQLPKSPIAMDERTQTETKSDKGKQSLSSLTMNCVDAGSVNNLPSHHKGKKNRRKRRKNREKLKLTKQNESSKSDTGLKKLERNKLIKDQSENSQKQMLQKSEFSTSTSSCDDRSNITTSAKSETAHIAVSNSYCSICQCDFGNSIQSHLNGQKHRKKAQKAERMKMMKSVSELSLPELRREVLSLRSINQHLESKHGVRLQLDKDNRKLRRKVRLLKSTNRALRRREQELLRPVSQLERINQLTDARVRKNEEFRSAAIALRDVGLNKPLADRSIIEWAKDDSKHFTERSAKVNGYRLDILKQQKYASLSANEYLIENNQLNDCGEIEHFQHSDAELEKIKEFVIKNEGTGNAKPKILICRRWKKYEAAYKSVEEVLAVQEIPPSKCDHLNDPDALKGQKECVAKIAIPNGTILGQYVGTEYLREEYYQIYNGTKEEMEHLSFMHGDTFQMPGGDIVDLYVDGIGAGDSSPLLYINDGRANIRGEETKEDKERMNVEFVMVLCNGWPMILVRTTKPIKAGDSLWISYGPRFGLVLDEMELMNDDRKKGKSAFENALNGCDLELERPQEIFSDSDDDAEHSKNYRSEDQYIHRTEKVEKYRRRVTPSTLQHTWESMKIRSFMICNWQHLGNLNPIPFKLHHNQKLRSMVNVQEIEVDGIERLECVAKWKIPGDTILGQFIGKEMMEEEFYEMYKDEQERRDHARFVHRELVDLPGGKQIAILLDGLAADKTYPLLYIRDCNRDGNGDRKDANVKLMRHLDNGWPLMYFTTIKCIERGQRLVMYRGYNFRIDCEKKENDQTRKRSLVVADSHAASVESPAKKQKL